MGSRWETSLTFGDLKEVFGLRFTKLFSDGSCIMNRQIVIFAMMAGTWLGQGGTVSAESSECGGVYTMALTGDSIITRRLSVYKEPKFLEMIELIRGADVAYTNIEMLFHDYESFPMNRSGGTYMRADPDMARELAWAGFDIGSLANNHTGDYGVAGMRLTRRYVAEAGIVAAGSGEGLVQAREAKFLETGGARIAIIATSSRFPDHSRAGKSRGDIPARPGLSPLRFETTYVVTRDQLEAMRNMLTGLGLKPPKQGDRLFIRQSRYDNGNSYVVGNKPEVRTKANPEDMKEISAVVSSASRLADYTIVSIHAHQGGLDKFHPPQFLLDFAHGMIDAGADIVIGHGPHVLRGIEIYKGKLIFYSIGNFMYQNETLLRLPHENYERYGLGFEKHVADFNEVRFDYGRKGAPADPFNWESIVALPKWMDGKLVALELHPISLGFGESRTVYGRPMMADEELSRKIIGDLQRLSKPFGTEIVYRDGIGVVKIP